MKIMTKIGGAGLIVLAVLLAACTLFQKDPVGATLYSLKIVYEDQVKSAGQAYLDKQITKEQLTEFVGGAKKFYESYQLAVNLHEANQLQNPDEKIAELRKGLDALQAALQKLILSNKEKR